MSNYDLHKLNDKEFETLATDLIGTHLGCRVERFKPGRDLGVDGRFFIAGKGEGIVQAKHWARSGFPALLTHLTDVEKPKVDRLTPRRYLLVTSVPLSRVNKQAIAAALAPHVVSDADIWGEADIQNYLLLQPELVKRHYKLWLASAEVLRLMLNAPIVGRSQFKMQEIVNFLPKYVVTSRHSTAMARLDQLGTIIITGDAGIGKTTLAEHVTLDHVLHGFEICVIENSLNEAEGAWVNGRKQVFYFDDFLGRNYLAALNRHEDSHVLAFMRRVESDRSKRFILTSRATILQQGANLSDLFRAHNIDRAKYEIRVEDLSKLERAYILYNHIWFGNLSPEHIEQLYVDKRYHQIIGHRNFNPRLIAFITDPHKIAGVPASGYWAYIMDMLNNPAEIWRGVFDDQLDIIGRTMVALTVFNGGKLLEADLRRGCERLTQTTAGTPNEAEWSLAFERSYRTCVGTMLNREVNGNRPPAVSLFNPSVGDFLLRRHRTDVATMAEALGTLQSPSAIQHLWAMHRNNLVSAEHFDAVLQTLGLRFLGDADAKPDFIACLANEIITNQGPRKSLEANLRTLAARWLPIAEATTRHREAAQVTGYFLNSAWIHPADSGLLTWIRAVIKHSGLDEDLVPVSTVIASLDDEIGETAAIELSSAVLENWKENIDDYVRENSVVSDYYDTEGDRDKARDAVRKFVDSHLSDYSVAFDEMEVDEIVYACDLTRLLEENIERDNDGEHGSHFSGGGGANGPETGAIDDLFDRNR